EGVCSLFGVRDRLTLVDPAQIATFVLGTGILGVLFGQFVELGALLGLLQDILGLLADLFDFGIRFSDRPEENVLNVNLVGHLILLDVGLILLFEHVIGNLEALAKLVDVQKRVTHRPALRNLIL